MFVLQFLREDVVGEPPALHVPEVRISQDQGSLLGFPMGPTRFEVFVRAPIVDDYSPHLNRFIDSCMRLDEDTVRVVPGTLKVWCVDVDLNYTLPNAFMNSYQVDGELELLTMEMNFVGQQMTTGHDPMTVVPMTRVAPTFQPVRPEDVDWVREGF